MRETHPLLVDSDVVVIPVSHFSVVGLSRFGGVRGGVGALWISQLGTIGALKLKLEKFGSLFFF